MKNIKLRTLALCLALVMVMVSAAVAHARVIPMLPAAGCCSNCGGTAFDNGFCTEEGCDGYEIPTQDANGTYQIGNAGQLYWFAVTVNGGNAYIAGKADVDAVLTADITVNKNVLVDGALNPDSAVVAAFRTWTPMGDYSYQYAGVFDGQNHTISGLYFLGDSSSTGVGLFGQIAEGAVVKNLGVVDSFIFGNAKVGAVAGYNYGTVLKCYNAGMVGYYESMARIIPNGFGGVVGENYGTVAYCYNTGTVSGPHFTGGVVGSAYEGTIENCYNTGAVSGEYEVGGITGYGSSSVTNCYYLEGSASCDDGINSYGTAKTEVQFNSGEVTYLLNGDQSEIVFGQTIGTDDYPVFRTENDGRTVYACTNCAGAAAYTNDPAKEGGVLDHNFVDGTCTICGASNVPRMEDGYYIITTVEELYWFANHVNSGNTTANAKLGENIVVNKNVLVDGALNPDSAVVAAFRTWTPIGGESIPYTGTFDGQNYTISGLYFNDVEASNVGLFGYMGETALVKNVTLAGSYFRGLEFISGIVVYNRGTVDGCINEAYIQAICYEDYETWEIMGGDSGGVAYYNYGTMTNCHNRGQVRGAWAGGVVNENEGTVNACSNEGYVASGHPWDSDYLGGVVVFNRTGGIVTNCYNTGTVYGSVGGGVVGYNRGTVRNCYNTGVSDCWAAGGGVVGWNYGTVEKCYNAGVSDGYYDLGGVVGINSGTVKNCYNTGAVSGGRFVGGVVGSNYKSGDYYGVIENCYNMGTVTCEDYSFGGVIGENDSGCTVTNCYYLDVVGDYTNPGGINGVDVAGQAEVMTLEQFKSGEVTYLLNGDQSEIVFGQLIGTEPYPVFRTENDGRTVYACTNCAGAAAYTNDPAKEGGVLDHNFVDGTCTICGASNVPRMEDGYYIITTVEELYWFANHVNSGNTTANAKLGENIVVNKNVLVDGALNPDATVVAAFRTWTPIGGESIPYTGTFDGQNYTISGLYFNDVEASNVGLFGYMGETALVQNVAVEDSYFCGDDYMGGIVGYNEGTVVSCSNSGAVSGLYAVGGIVGTNDGAVESCHNTGAVSQPDGAEGFFGPHGGVVGENLDTGEVNGCSNTGTVDSVYMPGGVAGYNGGIVTNCYNSGAVTGYYQIGGVIGLNYGIVNNCYNSGVVSGTEFVGAVAGDNGGIVTNCYYLEGAADSGIGETTGESQVEAKTEAQFGSGEVTLLLGDAFGQTLGTDDYPVFYDGSNRVCYGDFCPNKMGVYLNAASVPADPTVHTYEDGACIYCGLVQTIDLSEAVITVENAFYTGEAVTPAVVVTIGGQTLVEGVDYTVTYENNINIGTEAKVIITAVEGSAYTGTAEANFNILNCLTDFHALIEALEARLAELERQAEENTAVQEAIAEIRAEIEEILQNYATNADLEAALVRIAALESQVSDLKARMAAAEEAIEKLKTDLETLQQALEALQEAYGTEIPALQQALEALQNTVNDLDTVYATEAELEEAIAGVNGRIDALQQQIAALAETYATKTEVQGYIAALQALIDANSGSIETINALLEAINAELATLKNAEGEYRLDVIEEILKQLLETTIPGINALIKENAESIGINAEAIAALNETVSEIQDTLEDLAAEDARLAELIAGLETRLNDLQTSLEAALEALKEELLEELDKAKEELEEALEELKDASDEKAKALEEAIRALETLIEETEAALKTYTDEAMEKAVTAAQESLDAAIAAVEQKLEETREDLMQAINSGNADLAQRIEKVRTSLNAAIAANNATKIELTEQIRQTEAVLQVAIEKVSADLALAKQELIDAIIAGDTDLDEKFAALQSAMDAAMAASAVADDALKLQLNQAVETMNMAVQQVQKNLDEAKDELAKKDEKLNAMVVTAIVIASVGMAGCAGLAAFIIIDKRKLIK